MKVRKYSKTRDLCRVRIVHTGRVQRAKKQAIPESLILKLAPVFKVLGDPTRLRIVTALQGGEMCVCDLAAYLNLTESGVSHQLRSGDQRALESVSKPWNRGNPSWSRTISICFQSSGAWNSDTALFLRRAAGRDHFKKAGCK